MSATSQKWLHGLISAFIGGLATSVSSGLTLLGVDPQTYNLSDKLGHTILTVFIMGAVNGGIVAFAYLKQSPTPWDGTPETDRRVTPPQTPIQQAVAASAAAEAHSSDGK
jgi:hypothetical protein